MLTGKGIGFVGVTVWASLYGIALSLRTGGTHTLLQRQFGSPSTNDFCTHSPMRAARVDNTENFVALGCYSKMIGKLRPTHHPPYDIFVCMVRTYNKAARRAATSSIAPMKVQLISRISCTSQSTRYDACRRNGRGYSTLH